MISHFIFLENINYIIYNKYSVLKEWFIVARVINQNNEVIRENRYSKNPNEYINISNIENSHVYSKYHIRYIVISHIHLHLYVQSLYN